MIKCIERQFSIFMNINIIKSNIWCLYWTRQHVNGSHTLWVVHVASLVSQAPVFMTALGKCLVSPLYMNSVYGEWTAGLTLTIFSYFFLFSLFLDSCAKTFNFLNQPFNFVFLRIWFLFFWLLFVLFEIIYKIWFFLFSSFFNFLINQILSPFF